MLFQISMCYVLYISQNNNKEILKLCKYSFCALHFKIVGFMYKTKSEIKSHFSVNLYTDHPLFQNICFSDLHALITKRLRVILKQFSLLQIIRI